MKETDDGLEDALKNIDLSDKTEMQGVAQEIFMPGDSRSNLTNDEVGLILTCDVIFPVLNMENCNITTNFKNLAKSRAGWSTEKFVQAAGAMHDQRSGGSIGGWMKDRLFTPK